MLDRDRSAAAALPRAPVAAAAVELVRLWRNQRATAEAIRAGQLEAIGSLLDAASSTAFWQTHLGPVPADATWEVFQSLPTVDKALLRAAPETDRLASAPPPGSRTLHTSGTTGEPFRVHYPPRGAWWQGVLRVRRDLHRGIRPWQREANVRLFPTGQTGGASPLLDTVRRRLHPELPAGASPAVLADAIAASRPQVLRGYPHLLLEAGDALDGRHRPAVVATHGETLDPDARAELHRRYGVDPVDAYGTAECGVVAWQCRARDLYHVEHDSVLVEVLDPEGRPSPPGELGELVLTNLWNRLMPFVRYRTGDAGAWADRPCRCGHRLPALATIQGRTYRWIVDATGHRIAPQRLWMGAVIGLDGFGMIRRYQLRQHADRRIDIDVVLEATPPAGFTDDVVAAYRRVVGDLPVEVRVVDHLDVPVGEKFEVIRSAAEPPVAGHPRSEGDR